MISTHLSWLSSSPQVLRGDHWPAVGQPITNQCGKMVSPPKLIYQKIHILINGRSYIDTYTIKKEQQQKKGRSPSSILWNSQESAIQVIKNKLSKRHRWGATTTTICTQRYVMSKYAYSIWLADASCMHSYLTKGSTGNWSVIMLFI